MSLEDTTQFLAKYSWIYNFQVTKLLTEDVLGFIPEEWKTFLATLSVSDLNDIPFGKCQDSWPECFTQFVNQCLDLSIHRHRQETGNKALKEMDISAEIRKGMSPKKLHEVCHMTALVDHVTSQTGSNAVIDVGSGLGYLGQVLHFNYEWPVLGLESKQCHTSGAERRGTGAKAASCVGLQNTTCELMPETDSKNFFMSCVRDWFSDWPPGGTACHHVTKARPISESDTCSDSVVLSSTNDNLCYKSCNQQLENYTTETPGVCAEFSHVENEGQIPAEDSDSNFCHPCKVKEEHSILKLKECSEAKSHTDSHVGCKLASNDFQAIGQISRTFTGRNSCDSDEPLPGASNFSSCDCSISDGKLDKLNEIGNKECSHDYGCHGNESDIRLCMVGLHCCGDLTPTMLQYFAEIEHIRALCCVSCCYHRMTFEGQSDDLKNCPMSEAGKQAVAMATKAYPAWSLSTYALRLAAQETRARWRDQTSEDHQYHTHNVAYRALLELCLAEGDIKLQKTSRKLAHRSDLLSIDTYIAAVSKHIDITDDVELKEDKHQLFRDRMLALHDKFQPEFRYIEPITALQVLLQPVLETFIYRDRQMWLQEAGFHSNIIPVFDELLSPRNLALVAIKP